MGKFTFGVVFASCLIVTLGGCGTKVTTGGEDKPVVQEEEYRIGGVLAKDYYRQFLYQRHPEETLPYHYLSNSFTKLRKIDASTNLFFNASLFLLDGGDYVLDYQEVTGETDADGVMTIKTVFKTRVRGKWSIVQTTLALDGVGRAVGFKYNDKDTLNLKFDRAFNAPELKDKPDYFYYTSSNLGMPEQP